MKALSVLWLWTCAMTSAYAAPDAREVLRIGANDEIAQLYAPYQKFVEAAFQDTPWRIEWVNLPLARSIRAANEGSIDGDFIRIKDVTEIYSNLVAVPWPLNRQRFYLFIPTTLDCPDTSNIDKLVVGKLLGISAYDHFPENIKRNMVFSPNLESYVNMAMAHRIDGIAITDDHYKKISKKFDVDLKKCSDHMLYEAVTYMMLNIKHRDKIPRIVEAFSKHAGLLPTEDQAY
ncbi:hypothetical protein HCH_04123 [Hahella chejuensis KCTC 2396]|uniref:Solute-binding protein family 3/N-terminal domain-containing protein n=2 Tax=Hahella chejuensis TaxID=158327 RepID=Q2SEU1_HAHCH|nr:hypothetical protein HCH_04123 [Hahella chejuensis KCTC 2396]